MNHGNQAAVRSLAGPPANGIAVILLHGLCSTARELGPVEAALRALGYSVHPLAIDGYSFENQVSHRRPVPFVDWLNAVEHEVRRLRSTHERVMLVGISAGASLALGAAIRCGDAVDAMVLMSTALHADGWGISRWHFLLPLALHTPLGRFWAYRERSPYGVKNARVRAWIEREMRVRRISSAGSAMIGVDHLRQHAGLVRYVRRRLGEVRCRAVLALHAREDEVASLGNLDLLARGLRGTAFRSVVLNNSYHMITIDNDRAQVVAEVLAFLAARPHSEVASGRPPDTSFLQGAST